MSETVETNTQRLLQLLRHGWFSPGHMISWSRRNIAAVCLFLIWQNDEINFWMFQTFRLQINSSGSMSADWRQLEQQLLSLTPSGATVDLNTLFEAYRSIVCVHT